MTHKPDVPLDEVERFLVSRHGRPIESLAPLPGSFWSTAYADRVAGQELVLRLGTMPEGFEADRAAMTFNAANLPVPKVVAIGHAFGVGYAISERHYGRFLEDVRAEESLRSGPMLGSLLRALRAIEERPGLSVSGQPADLAPQDSWRNHLLRQLVDDGTSRNAGWRAALRQDAAIGAARIAWTPPARARPGPPPCRQSRALPQRMWGPTETNARDDRETCWTDSSKGTRRWPGRLVGQSG